VPLVLEWFGLAGRIDFIPGDGVSLHNFSPQVWEVDSFPTEIVVWVLLLAIDEDPATLHLGRTMRVRFTARDPQGNTVADAEVLDPVGAKRWPDLPHRARVSADMPIEATGPGWYEFSCDLSVDGSPASAVRGSNRVYVAVRAGR
jgi:hypothetical protein